MRLLIFTQKVDKEDSVLGFFHDWIDEISKKCESLIVICLYHGNSNLPKNVTIYSLGKEKGTSRLKRLINLYRYVFLIKGSYDKVFVHMNQEYVLLLGWYWRLKRIPIYLWRNHPEGSFLTLLSVLFSKKIFATSKNSFTARFKKTVIVPAGNNSKEFKPVIGAMRKKYSVCMIGRISPIKRVELGLMVVNELVKNGVQVSFDIIGAVSPIDRRYYESLKDYVNKNNISSFVNFQGDAPLNKHPELFSSYEICLNLTKSGSFDKSIIGAASCGAIPILVNDSLKGMLPDVCIAKPNVSSIANSVKMVLNPEVRLKIQDDLRRFADSQSLDALMIRLFQEIK